MIAQDNLPGGQYTAILNPDNTWTIKNVPIFAEHKLPNDKYKVTVKWLEQAIDKAQARLQEGYLAPLHINHHGINKTERAGFVLPKSIRKVKYEGKDVNVLFADLIRIPNEIYEEIKRGELPYRSVEIHNIENPEISSLALLRDEVPFFRFPMLTIGKELKAQRAERTIETVPLVAYREATPGILLLYSFKGLQMTNSNANTQVEMFQEGTAETEEERKKREEAMLPATAMQEGNPEHMDKQDMMIELLQKILSILEGESMADESNLTPVEMQAPKTESAVAYSAEVDGKIAAMDAKIKTLEHKDKVENITKSAMAKLVKYSLTDSKTEAKVRELADKGGEEAVNAYISGVEQVGTLEPPTSWDRFNGARNGFPQYPNEVEQYAQEGPEALDKARHYFEEYEQLKRYTNLSLKDFLADQFEAEKTEESKQKNS